MDDTRMSGRGGFQAVTPHNVELFLAMRNAEQHDFAGNQRVAVFNADMDKAWIGIHRALSDGTLYGTLGEPPLADAVLGEHLVCRTDLDSLVYVKYPHEVADIAHKLNTLSREDFEEKLAIVETDDEDMETLGLSLVSDEIAYIWPYFLKMREFYQRAAADGLAVLFSWG